MIIRGTASPRLSSPRPASGSGPAAPQDRLDLRWLGRAGYALTCLGAIHAGAILGGIVIGTAMLGPAMVAVGLAAQLASRVLMRPRPPAHPQPPARSLLEEVAHRAASHGVPVPESMRELEARLRLSQEELQRAREETEAARERRTDAEERVAAAQRALEREQELFRVSPVIGMGSLATGLSLVTVGMSTMFFPVAAAGLAGLALSATCIGFRMGHRSRLRSRQASLEAALAGQRQRAFEHDNLSIFCEGRTGYVAELQAELERQIAVLKMLLPERGGPTVAVAGSKVIVGGVRLKTRG